MVSVMAHDDSGGAAPILPGGHIMDAPVHSKLLCFIMDRCKILSLDDVVKICGDFDKEEEVMSAKALIERA